MTPDVHDKVPDDPLGLTLGQRLQSALDERIAGWIRPVGDEFLPDVPPRERTLKNLAKREREIT